MESLGAVEDMRRHVVIADAPVARARAAWGAVLHEVGAAAQHLSNAVAPCASGQHGKLLTMLLKKVVHGAHRQRTAWIL